MAFQRSYQDERGVAHPASYWRVKVSVYDPHNRESVAQMVGYANVGAASQYQSFPPLLFFCRGNDFDQYMSLTELNKVGMNPIRAWYLFIKSLPEWATVTDV